MREESGAALVEFALISPLLFFILAAIIDFALVFNDIQNVRGGVREAGRQGAVVNFGTTTSCDLTGLSGGTSNDIQKLMCMTKSVTALDTENVRVKVMFSSPDLSAQQSGGFQPGNALIICAQAPEESTTGLMSDFFRDKYIKTKTAIRIEQPSQVPQNDGYESALPGSDWSWCATPGQVSP